jgi:hypothetical protein
LEVEDPTRIDQGGEAHCPERESYDRGSPLGIQGQSLTPIGVRERATLDAHTPIRIVDREEAIREEWEPQNSVNPRPRHSLELRKVQFPDPNVAEFAVHEREALHMTNAYTGLGLAGRASDGDASLIRQPECPDHAWIHDSSHFRARIEQYAKRSLTIDTHQQ